MQQAREKPTELFFMAKTKYTPFNLTDENVNITLTSPQDRLCERKSKAIHSKYPKIIEMESTNVLSSVEWLKKGSVFTERKIMKSTF